MGDELDEDAVERTGLRLVADFEDGHGRADRAEDPDADHLLGVELEHGPGLVPLSFPGARGKGQQECKPGGRLAGE